MLAASDGRLWLRQGRADGTLGALSSQNTGIGGLYGSMLRKLGGTSAWDAGATSVQTFTGAGYVETVAVERKTARMIGLSDVDLDAGYASIDFAVDLANNGQMAVYEGGELRSSPVAYKANDRIRIERTDDGHIVYSKNGVAFYTSTATTTARLRADASFYTPGASLQSTVISAGGADPAEVAWVNGVGVGLGPLIDGVTTRVSQTSMATARPTASWRRPTASWVRRGRLDTSLGEALAQGLGIDGLDNLRKSSPNAIWGDAGASSVQTIARRGLRADDGDGPTPTA